MKYSILFVVLVSAAIAAGCAAPQGMRPWWTLHEADFAPMVPAKTTKADVERLVGKPLLTTAFPNLREEVWDYRFIIGTAAHIREIHFDMDGRLTRAFTYPDGCPDSPRGCY